MTPPSPGTLTSSTRSGRRPTRAASQRDRAGGRHPRGGLPRSRAIARHHDPSGLPREIVALSGAGGSLLVVDRDLATMGDCRLIAHLAADESAGNAELISRDYLARANSLRRCREVSAEDLLASPLGDPLQLDAAGVQALERCAGERSPVVDPHGCSYLLEVLPSEMSIPVLRWRRHPPGSAGPHTVTLREVVAALESYAPACELTEAALARHRLDQELSTVTLAAELQRVRLSPIVLNRALRSAVIERLERDGLSMSQLAIRCGRTKRDRNGALSGETSWLARRIGLLPEGGHELPTPWIHSDVLGLIARRGLGISPREVELQ